MSNKQLPNPKRIKKLLIDRDLKNNDLIEPLQKKNPHLTIYASHISMALAGKYPSMLEKINEVLEEAA